MHQYQGNLSSLFPIIFILLTGCTGATDEASSGSRGSNYVFSDYGSPYSDADFDAMMGNNQVYMDDTGSDSNPCTQAQPCRTFAHAISLMSSGDGLILLDGNYDSSVNGELRTTDADGNPVPNPNASDQLPTGQDSTHPTIVRALNPSGANVFIEGGFTLGTRDTTVNYVVIYGLTFFTEGSLRNANYSVVKGTGIYGALGVGTQDHALGCMHNLIEDVWIWGKNHRGNAVNYRANHNVWNRVLIRDDGCDQIYCGEGEGRLKISSTIYNSHDVAFVNMISIDKILRENTFYTGSYADFATAQHTYFCDNNTPCPPPEGEQNGRNSWLGSMVINSEDYAINFEAGEILVNEVTGTIRDFVALNSRAGATIDGAGCPYNDNSIFDIDDVYLFSANGGPIYSGCDTEYILGNNINTGAYTSNMASGRIPQYRYGTTDALWPWPYEMRIRHDICVRGRYNNGVNAGDEFPDTGIRATKSFCTYQGTLSDYIASF
jgi:hypothetical protein